MGPRFDRLMAAAARRKAAANRPFPQFTLRTMLLATLLWAIGLGVVTRVPIHYDAQGTAFLAGITLCVLLSFVVAVLRQRRSLLVWGSMGGIVAALLCPYMWIYYALPVPSWWEQWRFHFLRIVVPVLAGSAAGMIGAACVARWMRLRKVRYGLSREGRVHRASLPPSIQTPPESNTAESSTRA
jgi:putative effector of murein hydrolase